MITDPEYLLKIEQHFQRLDILALADLKKEQQIREHHFFTAGMMSISAALILSFHFAEPIGLLEILLYPIIAMMSFSLLSILTPKICRNYTFWPFNKISKKWQALVSKKEDILHSFRVKQRQFELCHFFEHLFECAPQNNEHEEHYRETLLQDLKSCFQTFNGSYFEYSGYIAGVEHDELLAIFERLYHYYIDLKQRIEPPEQAYEPDFNREYESYKEQYQQNNLSLPSHCENTEKEMFIGQTVEHHSQLKKYF